MSHVTLGDRINAANWRLGLASADISTFFVIIGAMKSGTTTLYNYLMKHPDVARNRRFKEPQFFSNADQWERGLDYYKRQYFPLGRPRRGALDGSTNYAKHPSFPGVPERMLSSGASFRFIYIMRHPIDRIESQMAHQAVHQKTRYPKDPAPEDLQHEIDVSSYAMQLDRYYEVFGDPKILLLSFEAFRDDPLKEVRKAFQFLELEPDLEMQPIGADNQRDRRAAAQSIRLSSDVRSALADRLRPDLTRLRDTYGFDVAPWGLGV